MENVTALVLAAGKGTRMKSDLVKVMHPVAGPPMIAWPVEAARRAGAGKVVIVVGHQGEKIRNHFSSDSTVSFAIQEEQLGTGHAVASAGPLFSGVGGTVLILCGDVPLIRPETLQGVLAAHAARRATVTVVTTHLADPRGYGRVITGDEDRVVRIVEEKDATPHEKEITEINSGIYCIQADFLFPAVARLRNDNAQEEYYLTDVVQQATEQGALCIAFPTGDSTEVMGVNDRVQLAAAAAVLRERINKSHMIAGVTLIDPPATYIDHGVTLGRDSVIYPNVHISGNTSIGARCTVEHSVTIRGCRIGNDVTIKSGSVLADAVLHDHIAIGPMAHLRPGTELMDHVKIGNFVETKKAVIGEGSKASHLTYLGDATIGRNVNVGCGTITCNYDGVRKHHTVIEDEVFVGSDVQFIAPVTIGRNSLIAAGATITQDVPPDSLAIARSPQVNKVGWKLKKPRD